ISRLTPARNPRIGAVRPCEAGSLPSLRTDSASFLSERQRVVSFSAFQADSASPRFASAHTASRGPPVTLPPLHLLSVAQRFAVLSRQSGACEEGPNRVAASAGVSMGPKRATARGTGVVPAQASGV